MSLKLKKNFIVIKKIYVAWRVLLEVTVTCVWKLYTTKNLSCTTITGIKMMYSYCFLVFHFRKHVKIATNKFYLVLNNADQFIFSRDARRSSWTMNWTKSWLSRCLTAYITLKINSENVCKTMQNAMISLRKWCYVTYFRSLLSVHETVSTRNNGEIKMLTTITKWFFSYTRLSTWSNTPFVIKFHE